MSITTTVPTIIVLNYTAGILWCLRGTVTVT